MGACIREVGWLDNARYDAMGERGRGRADDLSHSLRVGEPRQAAGKLKLRKEREKDDCSRKRHAKGD